LYTAASRKLACEYGCTHPGHINTEITLEDKNMAVSCASMFDPRSFGRLGAQAVVYASDETRVGRYANGMSN
jgi:hypothetical protein